MKKQTILLLFSFMFLLIFIFPIQADAQEINGALFFVGSKQYLSGKYVHNMDVAPFVENGRTYLPIRYLAEALGITPSNINWNPDTKTVYLTKEGYGNISVPVGANIMQRSWSSTPLIMDVPPIIVDNRVFLPARHVAEAFGEIVSWEPETNGILISRNYSQISPQQPSYAKQETTDSTQKTIDFGGGSYTGQVLNGIPHGKGRWTLPEGTIEGDFANGYLNGSIIVKFNDGGSYTGTMHNYSGYGTMVTTNGNKITGSFVKWNLNGYGEFAWASGDTYKGNFLNSQFHGEGVIYFKDGIIAKGIWENGQLVRWIDDTYPNNPPVFEDNYAQQPIQRIPITSNPDDTIYIPTIRNAPTVTGVIESRIDGNFEGWTGDTIFILENGQIWQQDSYGYTYRYFYRPKVTIYPSGISRYKMHVDGVGEDIYVKRIK